MPKLTPKPPSRVIKAFQRAGWIPRPLNPGKRHTVLVRPGDPAGILVIPRHGEVAAGTLRKLISQAGMTVDEFLELYR